MQAESEVDRRRGAAGVDLEGEAVRVDETRLNGEIGRR